MDDKQKAFQDFEQRGWQEVARTYGDISGVATSQVAEPLLDFAGVSRGQLLLDVATGPGFVAEAAARRGARPLGLDLSQTMVEEAARRLPEIEFRQGAAEALPFDPDGFDAVVSAFGMPHFADHAAFFTESHRVLRPGGRLAFATWQPVKRNPFFSVVIGAISRGGTLKPAGLPEGPDFYAFGEPSHCEQTLGEAGFKDVRTSDVRVEFSFEGGVAGIVRFMESGSVRTRALYQAQPEDARQKIIEAAEELLEPYREGTRTRVPATVILVSACVP